MKQINKILTNFCLSFLLVFTFFSISGCVTYLGIDGPYIGKVIDADTREPIEGAVVHASWFTLGILPTPSTYHHSKEIKSDKSGSFNVPGAGVLILSNLEMGVVIFKSGYECQSWSSWNYLSSRIPESKIVAKQNIQWVEVSNNIITFKLKKNISDQNKRYGTGIDYIESQVPKENHKLLDIELANDKKTFKSTSESAESNAHKFKHP